MVTSNFNSQTKRVRELAKKDKRSAKDDKRAPKKAETHAPRAASGSTTAASKPARAPVATATPASNVRSLAASAFIRRMNKTP
jgi:hypothetical protein